MHKLVTNDNVFIDARLNYETASVGYFIEYIMMHGTINIKSPLVFRGSNTAIIYIYIYIYI